jgi:hypothetical protein
MHPKVARLVSFAFILAACSGEPSAPREGRLGLTITGLPGGVAAAVTLSGPNGFTNTVAASGVVAALAPGSYTIAATSVVGNGFRFTGSPATQTVVVPADDEATASVTYAASTSRLTVEVSGLPQGAAASVQIAGPAGFTRAVTANTTLELLDPGAYVVTVADVQTSGVTFRSIPSRRDVTLQAGATQTIDVAYVSGVGALDVGISGLPAGVDGAVTVTGPNGFARTLSASATLGDLGPGTYNVNAATVGSNLTTHVPSPATQTLSITANGTSTVTVTYGSTPLRLGVRVVAEGLIEPVFLSAPEGDARLFIIERNGRIRIVQNDLLLGTPFLDITNRVNFVGERGMLGMAFDPAFATTGLFYVYYVNLKSSTSRIRGTNITAERSRSVPTTCSTSARATAGAAGTRATMGRT